MAPTPKAVTIKRTEKCEQLVQFGEKAVDAGNILICTALFADTLMMDLRWEEDHFDYLQEVNCMFIRYDFPYQLSFKTDGGLHASYFNIGRPRWNQQAVMRALYRLFLDVPCALRQRYIKYKELYLALVKVDSRWIMRSGSPPQRGLCMPTVDYF